MHTRIIKGDELREAYVRGAMVLRDAVKITTGPKGRNVNINRPGRAPEITNDGKKIVHSIKRLKDPFENDVIEMGKDITAKVAKIGGDNTSAATLIFCDLLISGAKKIGMGANPMFFRQGMEQASADILHELKGLSYPVKENKQIREIATISSESESTGKMIAEIVDALGPDGMILLEESRVPGISSVITLGMPIASGYASSYMVTDQKSETAEIKNPKILVTAQKISDFEVIRHFMEKAILSGKNEMVIIADDVIGEALDNILMNKVRGGFNVLCIKAPGYGEGKRDLLGDIALMLGTKVYDESDDLNLVQIKDLGTASSITSAQDSTRIVGGKGDKSVISEHVDLLRALSMSPEISDYDSQVLESRISSMTGGMAVIKVGAHNESDLIYLKDKLEDTIANTKGALEEGMVIGGGLALINAKDEVVIPKKKDLDFMHGYSAVFAAVHSPFKSIIENTGRYDSELVLHDIRSEYVNSGYNAKTGAIVIDMFTEGIIDSHKSIHAALKFAVHGAAALLSTEVGFVDEDEEKL